jgi:hypothetical protein
MFQVFKVSRFWSFGVSGFLGIKVVRFLVIHISELNGFKIPK